uniref:Uncharacterized protein n=1 Tax=Arundo donax TaxID=35708 RepID=A0A0A8ZI36_ARUDO
MLIDLGRF